MRQPLELHLGHRWIYIEQDGDQWNAARIMGEVKLGNQLPEGKIPVLLGVQNPRPGLGKQLGERCFRVDGKSQRQDVSALSHQAIHPKRSLGGERYPYHQVAATAQAVQPNLKGGQ